MQQTGHKIKGESLSIASIVAMSGEQTNTIEQAAAKVLSISDTTNKPDTTINTTIEELNPKAGANTVHIEGDKVLLTQERLTVGVNMQQAKDMFEAKFGVDKDTRTKKQWKALVKQYGMETVCKQDGLSKRAVKDKLKA
jgi:hypothetical protein